MEKFHCEYCGHEAQSVSVLVGQPCPKHVDGPNKGKHKLYEGSEKSQYTCKYCGKQATSIKNLVSQPCPKHLLGANKGRHAPSL